MAALMPAARTFSVTSRRKAALASLAASGVKGGTRRVFTAPARGALAMTAMAHREAFMIR
jgi:hypothetical protein